MMYWSKLTPPQRWLLALQLPWCVASLWLAPLPGWKMFAQGDYRRAHFTNKGGQAVGLRRLLPKAAHISHPDEWAGVAKFYCLKHPEEAPFTLRLPHRPKPIVLKGPKCKLSP